MNSKTDEGPAVTVGALDSEDSSNKKLTIWAQDSNVGPELFSAIIHFDRIVEAARRHVDIVLTLQELELYIDAQDRRET